VKVIVYVEGPSDKDALQALLEPIIDAASRRKIGINFLPQHGKAPILREVPRKAARHLHMNREDWVFALPDLYPMAYYGHRSFTEMSQSLQDRFREHANEIQLVAAVRSRFRVHCLKHDLEALLLAVPDVLRKRLGTTDALKSGWRQPVEDQNDDKPPKRVVEELFKKYRKKPGYVDTSDALWILRKAPLEDVEAACPQRFAPFVRELRAIAEERDPDEASTPVEAPQAPR
jgi:hypothetical protein